LNAGTAPLTSEETIYLQAAQFVDPKFLSIAHTWFQPSWIVRSAGPVEGLTGQMQRALASADPQLPFSGFYNMKDLMAATLATQRVEVALLAAMSSLALLLSAIGIFALVANMIAQRTREIGIRIALGSTIREAMFQIGRTGVGASAVGLVLGLILCAGVLRAMRSVLYGVGVYDVPTILVVALTLSAVTLLATIVPTLRIARIDPAGATKLACWCGTWPTPSGTLTGAAIRVTVTSPRPGLTSSTGGCPAEQMVTGSPGSPSAVGSTTR